MENFEPTPDKFLRFFVDWFNKNVADSDVPELKLDVVHKDAYIVWFCYILNDAKCLISTNRPDHKYYELTYDDEFNSVYVDSYLKVRHDEVHN